MNNKLPPFIEIYRQLIATPSISGTESILDQSNKPLVTLLAEWFELLGFSVELQPVPNTRDKFNLLAKYGQGTGGSYSQDIPIPFPMTKDVGHKILSPSPNVITACMDSEQLT